VNGDEDGVHVIGSEANVAVVGYRGDDSHAYAGGIGSGKINPEPEGQANGRRRALW
jgi:hypothetical protein